MILVIKVVISTKFVAKTSARPICCLQVKKTVLNSIFFVCVSCASSRRENPEFFYTGLFGLSEANGACDTSVLPHSNSFL